MTTRYNERNMKIIPIYETHRETMSIVWQRALAGKNSFDGAVDIR